MRKVTKPSPALACLVAAISLNCTACGKGWRTTYPVTGQVLYKGKPTPGAVVGFHPLDGNAGAKPRIHPNADCDKDGKFTLSTYLKGDGAPAGEYAVTVFWPHPVRKSATPAGEEPPDEITDEDAPAAAPGNRLPDRYGKKQETPLRFTVRPGDNELAVFKVEN